MNRLPTTRQLRYFVALEEQGHFGRAAEACFVSQSAFSVAIKALEGLLAAQLVDRTNKQVTVTALGREVATQARLCLRDIGQLVELAKSGSKPLGGRLSLGVIPTIAPFLLPKILPRVRKQYPELEIYIREATSKTIHQQLLAGELDLILLALPYPLRSVETRLLFRDHFLLACRDKTQLVDPRHFVVNRVTANSVLLLEDGHCLREHALDACKLRNLDAVNRFSASSLYTLLEMVDNDLGVTFLPEMALGSSLLQQTRIRTWPMPRSSYREIALGWRKGSARLEEFSELGRLIQALWAKTG